jgi:hypothetical protein
MKKCRGNMPTKLDYETFMITEANWVQYHKNRIKYHELLLNIKENLKAPDYIKLLLYNTFEKQSPLEFPNQFFREQEVFKESLLYVKAPNNGEKK